MSMAMVLMISPMPTLCWVMIPISMALSMHETQTQMVMALLIIQAMLFKRPPRYLIPMAILFPTFRKRLKKPQY